MYFGCLILKDLFYPPGHPFRILTLVHMGIHQIEAFLIVIRINRLIFQ